MGSPPRADEIGERIKKMLKLSMQEEVAEYKEKCEKSVSEAPDEENAAYWQKWADECEQLLTLFRDMKMYSSDWARMKVIAELNREERQMGY